jgi:hypothetical protein
MPFAERMGYAGASFAWRKRWTLNLEQREILPAAIQQDLIAKSIDDPKAQNRGVKALGARQIPHFDSEMIESFVLHAVRISLAFKPDKKVA